ncbi:hypothetical protein OQA88_12528 [Cercophora sp. LCS_1]
MNNSRNGGVPNENRWADRTNIAVWILITSSAVFLSVRLWCRHHVSKLWWDDFVLTLSWLLLLVAGALTSGAITVGSATSEDKRAFFRLQNTTISLLMMATSWSKVAFAITLTRIARHRMQIYFLWFIIVTATLVLIPGNLATWVPACVDPRRKFRPVTDMCYSLDTLKYLGGTTMVYGGVVDVVLALFPWLVIRDLLLKKREKIGLGVAMSLGALTGVVVVLRVFLQLVQGDNDFEFLLFISIFNFLEPAVTIIAQAIPNFRVLFIKAKRSTQKGSSKGSSGLSSPKSPGARNLSVSSKPQLQHISTWEEDEHHQHYHAGADHSPKKYGTRNDWV